MDKEQEEKHMKKQTNQKPTESGDEMNNKTTSSIQTQTSLDTNVALLEWMPEDCLSEYHLDRYLAGLGTQETRAKTQQHLQSCEICSTEYQRMERRREQFLMAPRRLPSSLQPKDWLSFGWLTQGKLSFGALCLLCIVMFSIPSEKTHYVGIKGILPNPTVLVGLKRGPNSGLVVSGVHVQSFDELRLAYRWNLGKKHEGFVFVIHRDAKGQVTPLYPESTSQKSLTGRSGLHELPGSLEVDEHAHGNEELWLCFSPKALTYSEIRDQLPDFSPEVHPTILQRKPCVHLHRFVLQRANTKPQSP